MHAASRKAKKQDNVAIKRYICHTCNLVCPDAQRLKNHNDSQRHKDKVAGITTTARPDNQIRRQRNITSDRHPCEVCKHSYSSKPALTTHLKSKKHANKLLELAASQDTAASSCSTLNKFMIIRFQKPSRDRFSSGRASNRLLCRPQTPSRIPRS